MNLAEKIGSNIQTLMNEHNVTVIDLAQELGTTRQTITNYIKGISVIDSIKLLQLSNFFGVSIEQILSNKRSFLFRTALNYEQSTNTVEYSVNNFIETYWNLCDLANEKNTYFPEYYNLSVECNQKKLDINWDIDDYFSPTLKMTPALELELEYIAQEQRKKLNAESLTGLSLIEAIMKSGINVFFINFNTIDIFGLSAIDEEKGCYIFINDNNNIPLERKIFTVAHEYAHLLLHRAIYNRKFTKSLPNNHNNKKYFLDSMADVFAGYFLCPRNLIIKYDETLKKINKFSDLIPIKHEFQISLSALIMSLNKYNYISKAIVSKYFNYLRESGNEKIEFNPLTDIAIVMYQYKNIKNMRFNKILSKIYLDQNIDNSIIYEVVKETYFEELFNQLTKNNKTYSDILEIDSFD